VFKWGCRRLQQGTCQQASYRNLKDGRRNNKLGTFSLQIDKTKVAIIERAAAQLAALF